MKFQWQTTLSIPSHQSYFYSILEGKLAPWTDNTSFFLIQLNFLRQALFGIGMEPTNELSLSRSLTLFYMFSWNISKHFNKKKKEKKSRRKVVFMEHLELIKHLCFPTMWNEMYISVYVNLVK